MKAYASKKALRHEPSYTGRIQRECRKLSGSLRIAHIFSTYGVGGAESFALSVSPLWQAEGHQVSLVNLWDDEQDLSQACFQKGISCHVLSCGKRVFSISSLGKLRSFFENNEFDVLLLYGLRVQLLLRLLKPLLPCKNATWITMLRGEDPWRRWPHILSDYVTQGSCDCHVGCSRDICETWLRREKYNPQRLLHIPNGIDLGMFESSSFDKAAERARLGLPENGIICTTVANLRSIKGYRFLADTIALHAKEFNAEPVYFLWLGRDMGEYSPCLEILKEAGIAGRVIWPGPINDVSPYLAASDLFILPSQSEGMPRALMEAMAMGLPAVATDVGGTGEVLRDGVDGRLVGYGDADSLASAILELAADDSLREKFGKSGRQRIADEFDLNSIAHEYLRLFHHLRNKDSGPVINRISAYKRENQSKRKISTSQEWS